MIPAFPYRAMTISGVFHIIFSLIIGGISIYAVDLGSQYSPFSPFGNSLYFLRNYFGAVIASSLWILMVGILGILTGVKYENDQRTRGLKIAYMVTSILSAVIFSPIGFGLPLLIVHGAYTLGTVGSIASFADFVLAIVSASICCCCANPTTNTGGTVYITNQAPPVSYPTGSYPPGSYPAGASYPAHAQ